MTPTMMRPITARPPITPPTMGPIGVDFFSGLVMGAGVGVGVGVVVGVVMGVDVGVLVGVLVVGVVVGSVMETEPSMRTVSQGFPSPILLNRETNHYP
jgi:hypothetical protein